MNDKQKEQSRLDKLGLPIEQSYGSREDKKQKTYA